MNGKKPQAAPTFFRYPALIFAAGIILAGTAVYLYTESGKTEGNRPTITYTQFSTQLKASNVKSVTIAGFEVRGEFVKPAALDVAGKRTEILSFKTHLPSFQGADIIRSLEEKGVAITVAPSEAGGLWQAAVMILPWVVIIGVWMLIMRRTSQAQGGGGGLFSFGASKARLFDVKKPGASFKDVAGLVNAKKELEETVEFLKNPEKFTRLGAKVPKGILLIGPPGTGKTLLARATAGEAGVPFYSVSASEFIEMFVGVGASRVRDMFKMARETSPSIIFIDEIDSVGRTRGTGLGGGHDEREQTLNQLLSEMDGFEPHEKLIIMAATNRPDVLDAALLRPGRFDRHIVIERPGRKERKEILDVHVRNKRLSADVDLDKIARGTPGMTGADIENITNEAAIEASKRGGDYISMQDFEDARDEVLMGAKRENTTTEEERKITAFHEAGHALVSIELPNTDPVHKVSIIPRGMAMGVTQFLPKEDRHYYPKGYLLNRLAVAMAGRAAEKLVFNDVSTGGQDDLKNATLLAERMVAQWGMSEKIGPVNLGRGEEHPFLGRELSMPKRYSEYMAWLMDQEIRALMLEAEAKADSTLRDKKDILKKIADALLEEESLDREDIERIMKGRES
ncbi:MAG: ATP-dependent zinc metalloprotease FtsH [Deltaproteobacteria bacterium]|nr:ATP-dependent zinc metalloprotease FtsH [Deltaproteobacteria bacterium]